MSLLTSPSDLWAQQELDPHSAAPVAHTVFRSGNITIDGDPGEIAWERADPITTFTQVVPDEGSPVSRPTEVRLLHDAEALYIAARFADRESISSRLARRDAYLPDSDWFTISLDTHHDHRTAYRFRVNPAEVRVDEALAPNGEEISWDPVWEARTAISTDGWTVEIRIPLAQLRFSATEAPTWGIQIEREIGSRQERAVFAFTPRQESGGIPRFGHLLGLGGIERGVGVELLPHLVARGEFVPVVADGQAPFPDPFRDGSDIESSAGVDLKLRLASNLTLDATVNPDFGQVEVDPAVVNLTQFETRFEEKRAFFVEGASIFDFGEGVELLYSRRIGGVPRWSAPSVAVYEVAPTAATILAATKLTGTSSGGWSVGFLDALTAEERGEWVDGTGTRYRSPSAPLSNFGAARLLRSYNADRTTVGILATTVHRRIGDRAEFETVPTAAYVGGVDFRHRWANDAWALTGHLAGSRVSGSPRSIEVLQRSSARYFHRPDSDHLALDPMARSLTGFATTVRLTRRAGLHWRGRAQVAVTSPGFEVNDAGFQSNADRVVGHARLQYVEERPGDRLRQWSVIGGPDLVRNFGGDHLGATLSIEANAQLLNYWEVEIRLDRFLPGVNDRLTRGGPLTNGVGLNRGYLAIDSDSRRWWGISGEAEYSSNQAGGWTGDLSLEAELRPAERWSLSIEPRYSRSRTAAQFLRSVADPLATGTYGRRYLFADLEETTLALEMRLNVTFTPALSFELFTQPFLSSGKFGSVRELRAPRTFDFLTYGEDIGTAVRNGREFIIDPDGAGAAPSFTVEDEDFTSRSLRGNAVLRWEWRPGSTLFLVWQQSRSGSEDSGELNIRSDVRDLLGDPGENIVMLKATWWIGR